MIRWLLLIFLAGWASGSPHKPLSIVLRNLRDLRLDEKSINVAENVTETIRCDSEICRNTAKYITKNMDKSVDPCDNFYEFACGKFPENNPMPAHMPTWSTWTIIRHNINLQLRSMLQSDVKNDELLPVKFAKKWYRSCMDEKRIEKLGLKPIEALMQRIGGWPMTMDDYEWDEDFYPWYRVEKYFLRVSGIVSLFQFEASVNESAPDNEKYDLLIGPPTLPFREEIPVFSNRKILYQGNFYENLIVRAAMEIAKLRRASVSKESVVKDAKDIIDFEKQLYKIILRKKPDEELFPGKEWINENRENAEDDNYDLQLGSDSGDGDSGYNNKNGSINDDEDEKSAKAQMEAAEKFLEAMQTIVNDILRDKVDDVNKFWQSSGVNGGFFMPLVELIQKTPMRTIVNYIHWNFFSHLLKHTTVEMRELLFKVTKRYQGLANLTPRWEGCITDIKMDNILSYMFVKEYFLDDVKDKAEEMITAIKNQIKNQINDCQWLDRSMKEILTNKLNNMDSMIGYPNWYNNGTAVTIYYKGLIIGRGLLDNVLSYMKFERLKNTKRFNMADLATNMWNVDPLTVTVIPAADFEQPFFSLMQPDYINFGTIGTVIGHEVMHAFDPNVIMSDASVKWPENMEKEYMNRATCFVEQYNKYSIKIPGTNETITINGFGTVGENVADSGVHAQYRAFKKWMLEKRKPHVVLPGLEEYTDDQLFFLALGNVWCETMRPKYLKFHMETDMHSLKPLRVIGMLSNSEEFSRAYKCPRGSRMNPISKCNIWK